MSVDISFLTYFSPLYGFLLIFLLVFAILKTTKILGGNTTIDAIIGVIIGIIFATLSSAQDYVQAFIPWVAVIIAVVFFILLIVGIGTKPSELIKPGFMWVFVIALALVLIITAVNLFTPGIAQSWQNSVEYVGENSAVFGAIGFLIIALIVIFIVVKK